MITTVALHADHLARGLRDAAAARIAALRPSQGAPAAGGTDCRLGGPGLDGDQGNASAEVAELVQLRADAGRAWAEDRWVDLVHLARSHGQHLRLAEPVAESMRWIEVATGATAVSPSAHAVGAPRSGQYEG
ncbi:hypothetical protein [Kitasatospora paranensis]|uniref:Uncharacterized protein n=1 Tax=Kitasatospora paranensis TaxID=258053 RepID=A0ABW2FSU5_9ACTN